MVNSLKRVLYYISPSLFISLAYIKNELLYQKNVEWDIAFKPDGIEVIEGNVCPSTELIQCNNIGLYRLIKSYL